MSISVLAILGPLGGAILALLVRRHASVLALVGAGIALAGSLVTLARVADGDRFATTLPGLPDWPLRLTVEPTGAILSAVVAVVSTFVLVYAAGYMASERDQVRFFAGMSCFVAAMQVLVLAGDWILLLAAWELIGLASYLLIGFWFERPEVGAAATRAFAVTRAADIGLYLGVIVIVAGTGTTAIDAASSMDGTPATVAGLALLLAAAGKSAQAPLQGWLLDAMAGPNPVSALLHAATLVVAGVVLLTRAFPLLPSGVLLAIGVVGGVSAIVTGLTAFSQRDLKRLLAASTSSQLGLMFLALGAGSVPAALFHLVTHAAMKSTLFLAAGVFQHDRHSTAFDDLQGIGRQRRATFAAFVVAGLALAGIPPLAGFWSKDAVIAAAMHSSSSAVLAPLAVAATLLTGVYIGRACQLLWSGDARTEDAAPNNGGMLWMGAGLGVLAILATGLGLVLEPFGRLLDAEVPEDRVALAAGLGAALIGLLAGWRVPAARLLGAALPAAERGFRIGAGWTGFIVQPSLWLGRGCDRLDRVIHDGVRRAGARALRLGSGSRALDERIHDGVEGVGRSSMLAARASGAFDRDGLDGFIAGLVRRTWRSGLLARQLQTGLVHRELLIAAGGTAVVLVLVFIV